MSKQLDDKLNSIISEDVDKDLLEAVKGKMEEKDAPAEEPAPADKEESDEVPAEADPAVSIENPLDPEVASVEDEKEAEEADEKKSVKESVAELLGDEFSEEFKQKATAIFEAAVKNYVMDIRVELEEEFNSRKVELEEEVKSRTQELEGMFEERVQKYESTLNDKIDGYLGFVSEEWMRQNEVAIESSIKTELTESFIMGIKGVFEQHYVDLPEEKLDMVAQLTEQTHELEKSLSRAMIELAEANKKATALTRENIITESVKGLTGIDANKMVALVEDFEFESEDSFKKRVSIVRETFFKQKPSKQTTVAEEFTKSKDVAQQLVEEKTIDTSTKNVDKTMDAYVRALGSNS